MTIGKLNHLEIDFIAASAKNKIYVQAAYWLAAEETVDRAFSGLESIPDNFPKYVVSMDEIDRGRNGIKHVNGRDFLLMKSY